MGRLPEYPLTPKRQVGTMCLGPRSEQGQPPWMYLSPQGCSLKRAPGSTRLLLSMPSRTNSQAVQE